MTREEAIINLKLGQNRIGGMKKEEWNALQMAIEALKDRPPGEWIDVENEPYCECSVCGAYIDNLDDDYAFCPRCGALMHKGGDDE